VNNRGHVEAADTGKRNRATQKAMELESSFTQIQCAALARGSHKRNRGTGE
jgi:hypothetical protein